MVCCFQKEDAPEQKDMPTYPDYCPFACIFAQLLAFSPSMTNVFMDRTTLVLC